MQFRTELHPAPFAFRLTHSSEVVFLGSCFAENIGNELAKRKFPVTINPHGILFNPYSLSRVVTEAIEESGSEERYFLQTDERWQSFMHHSQVSSTAPGMLKEDISQLDKVLSQALSTASTVFITLGTAWVYEHISLGQIVANCHKVPAKDFEKKLLSPSEIQKSLQGMVDSIQTVNPQTEIVFTVSPVRHIKDGMVENSLSKSLLIAGAHQCVVNNDGCHYFPSYELLMDDLRDYRFYDGDMIHPSKEAIAYCWEKFSLAFFDEKTIAINQRIEKVLLAQQHRFRSSSVATKEVFAQKQIRQCKDLENTVGRAAFQDEITYFESLL